MQCLILLLHFRSRQAKHSQSGTGENCHHPADLPPLNLGLERDVITHVLTSLLQYVLRCLINRLPFKRFLKEISTFIHQK